LTTRSSEEAIRNELARGGQIFFVHNNVQTIDRMAAYLKERVPEVRLAVAHGQMAEDDLESVMMRFMTGKSTCWSAPPSSNRASMWPRPTPSWSTGRTGSACPRCTNCGVAWAAPTNRPMPTCFIPEESRLGKDAQKRLKVLMEHSDLGSGFQIAMNDLKIRGGGAILGASQSGHIAAVGYDMFLKLMEEAVAQLKGEPIVEGLEPEINLPMSAHIPKPTSPISTSGSPFTAGWPRWATSRKSLQ
jgi:transcription-repair coupling factor (superfamily II helicase)